MEDSRWPNNIYQWPPHGRTRRGRPQQSWKSKATDFMRSRNMEEDMPEDRHLWRLGVDDCIHSNNRIILMNKN